MEENIKDRVEHGYAISQGVKIHFAALGSKENPLIVFIHGFPDFWYSWKDIMDNFSKEYFVIAIDQRGYNLSDKPKGEKYYNMNYLVGDVLSVITHLGFKKSIIVGHDWGGSVAWALAMMRPQVVDRLILLNSPHPRGIRHTAEKLVSMLGDNVNKNAYLEAFDRSDFEAMLHYYRQNYPREPYALDSSALTKVRVPVLVIHGLDDKYLLAGALNHTWEWVEKDLTLVTIPGAGHFVHHDKPELVNRTIKMWLNR
ncbi:alpha/beta hydrolase [uncultured Eudoraea sp.]|uniref:alpha/beta fold hydrolase n=1 Tax=uncultured Eudoraea sp. TaxID=1035614 RepID=UPI00262D5379|nr:alpha/beta hydrolase [uncultured Eudoraea sp.]